MKRSLLWAGAEWDAVVGCCGLCLCRGRPDGRMRGRRARQNDGPERGCRKSEGGHNHSKLGHRAPPWKLALSAEVVLHRARSGTRRGARPRPDRPGSSSRGYRAVRGKPPSKLADQSAWSPGMPGRQRKGRGENADRSQAPLSEELTECADSLYSHNQISNLSRPIRNPADFGRQLSYISQDPTYY